MRKRITLVLALAVALWGINAFAQGRGQGRPGTTGLEHAEATVDSHNAHGEKGIETAETKQSEHKKNNSKKHKHSKTSSHKQNGKG